MTKFVQKNLTNSLKFNKATAHLSLKLEKVNVIHFLKNDPYFF